MVLITGTTGFVGKNLVNFIHNSYQLKLLGRTDLNDIGKLSFKDAEVVIHLAGKAHDLKKVTDPQEYYKINYELTKDLYTVFLKSEAKKFVFVSSVKASADSVLDSLSESNIPNPQTHYGKSKLMAEQFIQNEPLPAGKSYYILRPCMIHGPGNKGNLNLLYQLVKRNIPYPLAAFENKRSFLSIENLCFVIKELIERDDIASGTYQISDDEPLSTNEVVRILSASINKDAKLWRISPELIRLVAKLGDKLHLPLTTERLNKLTENYVICNKKIKNAIGKDLPLNSRKGLEITASSFK
ncbi:NAD-dependent epimerase/dehydratase family protein [Desertivirga arenae]|uniref:NAD-dependent epimerase/dehydratase family protein n=1 Tax=Desertivirga arenae TaxID=2810309 RepID=UPI001A967C68|nr:NAD-dependent epimerase/dehydratase family protein [Pedobacter sp. SYSU D00823]